MAFNPRAYTAVLYFHGIGNPRRHVSISQFLDCFDRFGQGQRKEDVGRPRDFEYKVEVLDDDDVVHLVEFKRVTTVRGEPQVSKRVRVYEGYWVPKGGSRSTPLHILYWAIRRVLNPVIVEFSDWRSFPGLKLAELHKIAGAQFSRAKAQRLERAYRDFENWESREQYRNGSFKDFLTFLVDRNETALTSPAREWNRKFSRSNVRRFFFLLAILICLVFLGWATARSILETVQAWLAGGLQRISPLKAAVAIVGSLVGAYVYLQGDKYIFDVIAWTAQSERGARFEARDRVVRYAQRLVRHVLSDPNCENCIVVGHSLGTSIALESLLREGRLATALRGVDDDALARLEKVRFIFTVGSPIDRIFYLFQTDNTFSHRYSRLYEEQRLTVELPPFTSPTGNMRAVLVNFWTRFDPISSSLISPRKNVSDRVSAILNYEALPPKAPLPIGAHTTYFADPTVMKAIYWAVMTGRLPSISHDTDRIPKAVNAFGRLAVVCSAMLMVAVIFALSRESFVLPSLATLALWLIGGALLSRSALRAYQRQSGNFLRR